MNVKPLQDRVILKRIDEAETVRGGIIIPDSAKEKQQEGEVVAVGSGKRLEDGTVLPLEVKEGDRVLFGKYSGTEIKLDGEEYLIVKEDEILGITQSTATAKKAKK
jgi:chaperonin GroES